MLTKQMSADPRLAPVLEKITQQSFRASEIVNGLLNFSRTGTTEFTSLNLNALVRDTLTLLDHQIQDRTKMTPRYRPRPFARGLSTVTRASCSRSCSTS